MFLKKSYLKIWTWKHHKSYQQSEIWYLITVVNREFLFNAYHWSLPTGESTNRHIWSIHGLEPSPDLTIASPLQPPCCTLYHHHTQYSTGQRSESISYLSGFTDALLIVDSVAYSSSYFKGLSKSLSLSKDFPNLLKTKLAFSHHCF